MLRIREGYLLRNVVGEWIVVGVGRADRGNRFMVLNDTAARLWEMLAEGTEEDTLAGALAGEYSVDEATARADAAAFVERLLAGGIAEAY